MKYYVLKTPLKDSVGLIPNVHMNMDLDERKTLENTLTKNSFYEDEKVIDLMLNEREGVPSRLTDWMIWWRDSPDARHMVCSPKLKSVLEQFVLPSHRFYQAQVYIKSTFQMEPYFVFHFHFNYINEIILEETIFIERHFRARTFIKRALEKGFIRNSEHFYQFADENAELTYWFYPDKLRFKPGVYFDFFSTEDGIIINEKVKQAIELSNLTGIGMEEYTAYEIIMEDRPTS
jgi:hypothetical protein